MKKWKQTAAVFLAVSLTFLLPMQVMAAVDLNAVYEIFTNQIAGWPTGPEISSDTGVLMDADSGILLYNKGGDEQRYPASITKIMTLLLAVEHSSLDEQVTFTETGTRDISWDSGNIGMQVGEVMSMQDCLYALIIHSANEVAAQIAEHVGGTEQNFIDMMNQRAAEIGCTNTHFCNASGLPDENHCSTARDMALIMREGLKNETFRQIIGNADYTIQPTNMNSEARTLHTHHPMFAPESGYHYDGCIGGKTGFTNEAGNTLVTAVERNGITYISVTMRAADLATACVDSTAMMDYAYRNFSKTAVDGGSVLVPNGTDISMLNVKEEEDAGNTVQDYYFGDYLVGTASVPLPTETPVPTPTQSETESTDSQSTDTDSDTENLKQNAADISEKKTMPGLRKILLLIMGAMVLLLIVLLAALIRKKHRSR